MTSLLSLPSSILREIVSYFAVHNSYRASERGAPALVTLSTTCRLLSEHALDQLWGELPSLVPLVLAMPADLAECIVQADTAKPRLGRGGLYANLTQTTGRYRLCVDRQVRSSSEVVPPLPSNQRLLVVGLRPRRPRGLENSTRLLPDGESFPNLSNLLWSEVADLIVS
ncbi:hypothetical protein C8T65DRAFT_293461 [Cerioporus squamosus]|nr:hypothetical protein C8T65DRAFT_293461 [Cerioporus squamosus]